MPRNNSSGGKTYTPAPTEDVNGDLDTNKKPSYPGTTTPTPDGPRDRGDPETGGGGAGAGGGGGARELTVFYSGDTGQKGRRRRTCPGPLLALCLLCLVLFVASVVFSVLAFARPGQSVCTSEHCVRTAAQLLAAIDPTADPCDDFFQYACGAWNRKHIIPEDKSSYNTFEKLHDELQVKLKMLLEEPENERDTSATAKSKVLYASCINSSHIERVGDQPLRNVLRSLGGWPVMHNNAWPVNSWSTEEVLGSMRNLLHAPFIIDAFVGTDDKDSTVHIIQLDQPSLGMPSREYYLQDKEIAYRRAYLQYMISIATLLGTERSFAEKEMTQVLQFEIDLANVTIPQSERHDTGALYTKISVRELQDQVPEVDWFSYFNSFMPMDIKDDEQVVSFAMPYLRNMAKLVQRTNKRVLSNYLLWRLILGLAPEMTEKFQRERNQYRRVLQGVSRDKVRWQKCVEYVNERMGMAVGKLFIRDNFKKESKDTALEMIHNIREAFNEILIASDWMDSATKAVASEKANAMNERIGYPDFILDVVELDKTYDGLEFRVDTYFDNILSVEKHDSQKNLRKLREPVKKDKWEQDPAVVNAFYNPNTNDIVFPAGILQPLFYSQHFPKSLNYGGIGVVIGHEITHGFDDKGRQYDKDGNLRQWWTNETVKVFRERAQCMIDQYSGYLLQPFGLKIHGKNTQGENIADNGGLKESFRAYRKWVERNGGEEEALPGINLTHNQLFFLNYAQIWCGIMRDEEALHKIRTSVHSPGPIRVLGPLSNSYDFAEAYKCEKNSRMNPNKKCSVW